MMDDLDRLIEAVEAGAEDDASYLCRSISRDAHDVGKSWPGYDAMRAYRGSLDAALRLHEALLPGWVVHDFTQYPLYWHIVLNGNTAPHFFHSKDPSPARAWLRAILRAVKAQQSPGGGA